MSTLEILWAEPLLRAAVIIIAAILIDSLWYWPVKFHPLAFFKFVAQRMEKRVNRATKSSPQQNKIAGSLAIIMLTLPLLICTYLFLGIVLETWFFEMLILLIAISFHPQWRNYKRVANAVRNERKALSKDVLSSFVLRDTQRLSPLGCAKAGMESITLRFYYQVCVVIFWFFVAGPTMALGVRLVYECQQAWPTSHKRTQFFGQPARVLFALFAYLPCVLTSAVLALFYRPLAALRAWFAGLVSQPRLQLLRVTAYAINAELSGPVMIEGRKRRFPRYNTEHPTRVGHLQILQHYISAAKAIVAIVYLLIATIILGSSV